MQDTGHLYNFCTKKINYGLKILCSKYVIPPPSNQVATFFRELQKSSFFLSGPAPLLVVRPLNFFVASHNIDRSPDSALTRIKKNIISGQNHIWNRINIKVIGQIQKNT